MNLIVHSSDISNPMKPWEVYAEWTPRVLAEFWDQVMIIIGGLSD